jgi:hypothetical protein
MTRTVFVEYQGSGKKIIGKSVDAKDYDDAMRIVVRISMQGLTYQEGNWARHIPPHRIVRLFFLNPKE